MSGSADSPAVVATSDGKLLCVDRLSGGERLWSTPLAASDTFTARTVLGVSGDGRRVVFAEPFFLRVFEATGDDTKPVRQWTVRHDGAATRTDRKVTADGRRLVSVATGALSKNPEIVVRVTDLSPVPSTPTLVADGNVVIERAAVEGQEADRAGFVVRDAAGREYGRIPGTDPMHRQSARVVAGRYLLVSVTAAGSDRLEPLASSWRLFRLDGPGAMPGIGGGRGVAFTEFSDGPRLALRTVENRTGRPEESLRVFEPEAGQTLQRIELPRAASDRVAAVRFLPTKHVLVASRMFDGPKRKNSNNPFSTPGRGLGDGRPSTNTFDPSETITLRLLDSATAKEVWTARVGRYHTNWRLVVSPDGREAYCSTQSNFGQADVHAVRLADGVVRTFRVAESGSSEVRGPEVAHIGGIAPDGRLAIVAGEEVQLWDCATGQVSGRYLGSALKDSRMAAQVRFSTDGRRMIVAGTKLHVWDLSTDRELLTMGLDDRLRGQVAGASLSFDGNTVVVGGRDGARGFNGTPEKP